MRKLPLLVQRFALPSSALLLLAFAAVPAAADQASPVDLMPLKKAMTPLAGNGLLEVKSSFKLSISRGGITLTSHENVHILARRPGSFRAEISMIDESGTTQKKFLVVSDGKRVWTYRLADRAYSVVARQAFGAKGNDVIALALTTGTFFLGDGHVASKGLGELAPEDSGAMLEGMTDGGMLVTSKAQSVKGMDYIVYHLRLPKKQFSYLLYLNPQTSTLERVDLSGKTKGTQIAVQETLTTLRVPASVPTDTFTWSPPPGAKKSAAVTVDPF